VIEERPLFTMVCRGFFREAGHRTKPECVVERTKKKKGRSFFFVCVVLEFESSHIRQAFYH
jgi:hypothetical protein